MMQRMNSSIHGTIQRRVRESGQRYTAKRQALAEVLVQAGRPLSIPEILSASAGVPQSSVYRNLSVLERAGVVRRVITEEEFGRYELSEDLTEHHHHLICSLCGQIQDVAVPASLESTMGRTMSRLARRRGFATASHRLDVFGTCSDCA
jgi:Fe2+ or Zn2+ uptake regulation protein